MNTKQEQLLRISAALAQVDRKRFIDADNLASSHSTPSEPALQRMLEVSYFKSGDKALHIGAGSGYISAVLAHLCQHVLAFEVQPDLARSASGNLQQLGLDNVELRTGDGAAGARDRAPFDVIFLSTPKIVSKTALLQQLAPQGRLICIEQGDAARYILVHYFNRGDNHFGRSEHGYIEFISNKDDALVDIGIVKPEVLREARKRANENKTLLIDEVRKLQTLDDLKLYKTLASQYGLQLGNLKELSHRLDPDLFTQFSSGFLKHQHVVPLCLSDSTLTVVSKNPTLATRDIQSMFPGKAIEVILVTPTDFQRLWSALDRGDATKGIPANRMEWQSPGDNDDLLDSHHESDESRPIAIFEALMLDAVADRASDIHLERYGARIRVRLRVDGSLIDLEHYHITTQEFLGLINVIKLRGDMNIAERRLPQGGRSQLRVGDKHYDLRIQVQPSLHGEHVVIRLLPQNSQLISIEALGMPDRITQQFKRLLSNPAGLVLVVGPTGSGKSTTLYAGLQLLAADGRRKVITVEDPIEYSIEHIQQTRVRPDIGFNFADAMRSFVRQDPDVIMVGEIRDHETAQEALRASQTGHIVLSTLHCNDTVDAVQRLFDLNVHPNSLASELLAVIAQRLAKKICPHCKHETTPDPQILSELFPVAVPNDFRCYAGTGCDHCNGTGTRGRIAVIEYLHLNPDLRISIGTGASMAQLRAQALDSGLTTMRDSALDHVIAGIIPLEELPRVLPEERMAPEKRGQWQPL